MCIAFVIQPGNLTCWCFVLSPNCAITAISWARHPECLLGCQQAAGIQFTPSHQQCGRLQVASPGPSQLPVRSKSKPCAIALSQPGAAQGMTADVPCLWRQNTSKWPRLQSNQWRWIYEPFPTLHRDNLGFESNNTFSKETDSWTKCTWYRLRDIPT